MLEIDYYVIFLLAFWGVMLLASMDHLKILEPLLLHFFLLISWGEK
jgi:hypothetical protein